MFGHIDKRNRKTQSEFLCVACGHRNNADRNAARNISGKGSITKPMFAHQFAPVAVESPRLQPWGSVTLHTLHSESL